MFKLRPHHGLCIQHFQGKGYSGEFVGNMTRVIEFLNRENPVVRLTCNTDEICSCCPNNQGGICRDNPKVNNMDNMCLESLSLREGEEMSYRQYKELAVNEILGKATAPELCESCQWHSLCYGS